MSKIKLRELAISLRKQNLSYFQIKERVNVPKSTLSSWLHPYPLSPENIKRLRAHSEIRIEKFRHTMQNKRKERLEKIYNIEKNKMHKLTKHERLIAGLALYWGEGRKTDWATTSITNTDPQILQFFIKWLKSVHNIKPTDMRVALQLYSDMDIQKEITYWSDVLKLPTTQFIKPYIKSSISSRINHKGAFGHGTCAIMVYGVELKQKIMIQLKIMAEM